MLDNSTPFCKESAQLRAVSTARALKSSEQAAVFAAALRAAGASETSLFAEELVRISKQNPVVSVFPRPLRFLLDALRRLAGAPPHASILETAGAALAERWADLPPGIRGAALQTLRPVLTRWVVHIHGRDVHARASAARLVADLDDPGLTSLLPALLVGRTAAQAAEETLILLAGAATGTDVLDLLESHWEPASPLPGTPAPAPIEDARRQLHARVAALALGYAQHRRQGILRAALILLDPASLAFSSSGRHKGRDALARWFFDSQHESHLALRSVLKRSGGALVRQRAWEWLGTAVADTACIEKLSQPASTAEHGVVLQQAHLVTNPARARRLRQMRIRTEAVRHGRALLPVARQFPRLNTAQRLGTARLAAVLDVPADARADVIARLVRDSDPRVRYAALCARPAEAAPSLFDDPHPAIALAAALQCSSETPRRVPIDEPTLALLTASRHRRVQDIAESMSKQSDPWNHACERSRLVARQMLQRDREGFLRNLRHRLETGSTQQRLSAIMLARTLSLTPAVELELLRIAANRAAGDRDQERLVATAVAALGETATPAAAEAVRLCLMHPVGRIRANAAEALLHPRMSPSSAQRHEILELKQDSHHRVRANIVRGMLLGRTGMGNRPSEPAAGELLAMLADARPLHRLAGLWVLERGMVWGGPGAHQALDRHQDDIASRLAEIATDEQGPLRQRAARCARLLLARMSDAAPAGPSQHTDTEAAA